ncbi:hypothetical protein [Halanaerobium saccharolyticum]|nr:hypothetical protein [Halanaerobium saccharolyticum]
MIKNLELNKKLWLVTAVFYLILSLSFLALALLNFQQLKIKK